MLAVCVVDSLKCVVAQRLVRSVALVWAILLHNRGVPVRPALGSTRGQGKAMFGGEDEQQMCFSFRVLTSLTPLRSRESANLGTVGVVGQSAVRE